ncbi:MAG: hypothetical protein L7U72_02665 [Rubripirellula sp.]|nr:hypothetical protein [Rubripirellula sp.]
MNRWGMAFVFLIVFCGCDRLRTEYGESRGAVAKTSLNGFAGYRLAYENAGYRSRDITRLSNRVRATEVIVWTPKVLHPISQDVTQWMESWLSQGDRTLVFVLPDSGSEVDYWSGAAGLAPPDQLVEYRRREVRGKNQQLQWRLNRQQWDANGWFAVMPLDWGASLGELTGPWLDGNNLLGQEEGSLATNDSPAISPISDVSYESPRTGLIEYRVQASDPKTASSQQGGVTWNSDIGFRETGPGSLTAEGSALMADWDAPRTTTKVTVEPLLKTGRQQAIVTQVRSKSWGGSKILVVAGGSLLTNYALSKPWNRRLADEIILSGHPRAEGSPVVGFLRSDWVPIAVANNVSMRPVKTGMEMLTEWPLSLITMHGIFLGGVVCLIMIPILGRARKLQRESPSDFGHHLDAVGALLKKAKGETYARRRLKEYAQSLHADSANVLSASTERAEDDIPKDI